MKVLDLFSGIGGFSLGLHRASKEFKTVAFCEMDPFCTQILNKHWPDVPVYPDIRKLNGKEIGTIDIVCGGFPCQPFSQAGKRRGKEDDRDLWPEMFRIIQGCKPRWIIGENVSGFVNMELDRTVSDLESEGYEVRTFVLGACAVQAPHQRQRCWIIGRKRDMADSESLGHRGGNRKKRGVKERELQPEEQEGSPVRGEAQGCGGSFPKDVADSEVIGIQGSGTIGKQESGTHGRAELSLRDSTKSGRGERSTQRGMGHLADGLSAELLDIGRIWHIEPDIPRVTTGEKDRVKKLKALGNSVVPQIPEIIGRLIIEVENGPRNSV